MKQWCFVGSFNFEHLPEDYVALKQKLIDSEIPSEWSHTFSEFFIRCNLALIILKKPSSCELQTDCALSYCHLRLSNLKRTWQMSLVCGILGTLETRSSRQMTFIVSRIVICADIVLHICPCENMLLCAKNHHFSLEVATFLFAKKKTTGGRFLYESKNCLVRLNIFFLVNVLLQQVKSNKCCSAVQVHLFSPWSEGLGPGSSNLQTIVGALGNASSQKSICWSQFQILFSLSDSFSSQGFRATE